ncbi:hypothetical protein D9619_008005 [Psilocybe cf. subviscida]|uniref:Phospholipase/carboxylesterase/thioesterase domain-containing protein n=1 Tax=Psilocybe cf. subviscida TaxID=2480587 RepID=A0A8H5ATR7_9AGAR|nr:hypothetical protein D9619_008005 [Psilocybe cf. subviscida]
MTDFHLRETSTSTPSSPKVKPPPKTSKISGAFFYAPSDDGTDENLLILLHGLGDTHRPFSKLGQSLKLPQTAVLALRAPEQVPFLYEDAWQWYPSFDDLGEPIARPNPTPAIRFLTSVVDHLTKDCAWPIGRIHLFGFAQGGSVAAEFVLDRWKAQLLKGETGTSAPTVASVVSISGPLLSYPTLSSPCPTPVLLVHRPPPSETALPPDAMGAYKKGFVSVKEVKLGARGPGMPASKEEWHPIMEFWSQNLSRRQVEGLYEVMTGTAGA